MHINGIIGNRELIFPPQEHAQIIEAYQPKFAAVSQEAAIAPIHKAKDGIFKRSLKGAVRFAAVGVLGATGLKAYRGEFGGYLPKSYTTILHSRGQSNMYFWAGFAIASAAQFALSVSLTTWLWTKLDVQQEFTHYPARRLTTKASVINRKQIKPPRPRVLDPLKWRNFKLSKKIQVSPNVYRFVFALPQADDILGLPTGQHIALRANVNGQNISRSYTPVSNNTDLGRIELLVKVYPGGLMTQHLENMEIGDTIEIRGPKGAMQYSTAYAKHIGMIAGGTGITPMYQLIRAICEDESDNTKISLLYANNTEEDILLKEELDNFTRKCPNKFQVNYVLSRPSDSWTGLRGFVTAGLIKEHLAPASEASKALLCGPPPMINAMTKNLVGLGFQEPGVLSKATDQVFVF